MKVCKSMQDSASLSQRVCLVLSVSLAEHELESQRVRLHAWQGCVECLKRSATSVFGKSECVCLSVCLAMGECMCTSVDVYLCAIALLDLLCISDSRIQVRVHSLRLRLRLRRHALLVCL